MRAIEIGEIIQIAIGIFVAGYAARGCLSSLRIANENGGPSVGMNFRAVQLVGEKTVGDGPQLDIVKLRADIRAHETSSLEEVRISDCVRLNSRFHESTRKIDAPVPEPPTVETH